MSDRVGPCWFAEGDSRFFSGIVGALSVLPLALPVLIGIYARVRRGSLEGRMLVKDASFANERSGRRLHPGAALLDSARVSKQTECDL